MRGPSKLLAVLALSFGLGGCGGEVDGDIAASTTTLFFGESFDSAEAVPSDFGSPGELQGLEGRQVHEAAELAREQGWTQIEQYTESEFESTGFDADFRPDRLRIIFDPDTNSVLRARVG